MNEPSEQALSGIIEEVEAQKESVTRLKKEIFKTDKTTKSKYIKDFIQEYSRFESIACMDDVYISCQDADIIYVGDYHAVPQYQEFAAHLLNIVISRNSSVILASEIFYGHNQRLVDKWMRGDITESELLSRIRYQQEWGMPWEWYRPIFKHAQKHSVKVYAIDCPPRNQLRYISKRDKYAAEKIVEIVENNPGSKLVVLHGESHLAKNHLPGEVDRLCKQKGMAPRKLIIVQNIDEIYWQLALAGRSDEDVVRIDDERYCVLNISPIVKYEHYMQLIERWKELYPEDDDIDLSPTIYHLIDTILDFLKIDKYKARVPANDPEGEPLIDVFPEIYSFEDLRSFVKLMRSYELDDDYIDGILQHVQRHGSCYIPRLNCIYIGEFHLNDGGEEAAHFINFACRGRIFEAFSISGSKSDLFYQHVLEEALGYVGSKIINPKRNHFRDGIFFKYYRKSRDIIEKETSYTYGDFMAIVEFIIMHKKFELNYHEIEEIPPLLYEGISSTGEKYTTIIHELGYFLGEQLYEGFHEGKISRRLLRALFSKNFDRPLYSLELYVTLVERLNAPVSRKPVPAAAEQKSAGKRTGKTTRSKTAAAKGGKRVKPGKKKKTRGNKHRKNT